MEPRKYRLNQYCLVQFQLSILHCFIHSCVPIFMHYGFYPINFRIVASCSLIFHFISFFCLRFALLSFFTRLLFVSFLVEWNNSYPFTSVMSTVISSYVYSLISFIGHIIFINLHSLLLIIFFIHIIHFYHSILIVLFILSEILVKQYQLRLFSSQTIQHVKKKIKYFNYQSPQHKCILKPGATFLLLCIIFY